MKIDYEAVPDLFVEKQQSIPKGNNKHFCICCKKTLDEKQFFKTSRLGKFPGGILPHCKTCVTMTIEDSNPVTFLPILKEINVPYIPTEWRALLIKKDARATSILGKYVSKMRLNQFKKYNWDDTARLVEEEESTLLAALRQESDSESEAESKLSEMIAMQDLAPSQPSLPNGLSNISALYGLTEETSEFGLTNDEIKTLKITWGDYTEREYLDLEQKFHDMQNAYVIQDPIAIENARMICKMIVKMNKFLDIDDVESSSKMSRQLDLFVKTANLAPVQQKDRQQTTFAISQVAFLVEREGGFIPEFYTGEANDKIDMVLQDMKEYTEYLVRGETSIADMVENAEEILAQDALPEAVGDYDDFALLEAELLGDLDIIDESQEDE